MPEHKIVLLGQSRVGKTAIAVRFLQDAFVSQYDATVEDSYRKNVQIDSVHYLVEILDTPGNERMTAVPDLNWKDGQGFLLVFDVTDPSSFANLSTLREKITRVTERKQVRTLRYPLPAVRAPHTFASSLRLWWPTKRIWIPNEESHGKRLKVGPPSLKIVDIWKYRPNALLALMKFSKSYCNKF